MEPVRKINAFADLKILSDPRRLVILRSLMKFPATLTQLGNQLDISAARVRHHLIELQKAGLVELTETRIVRGFVEKYYRATASSFVINTMVLPQPSDQGTIYLIGSHDLALEMLAEDFGKDGTLPELVTIPVGSLDGLIALREGYCQLTGCHLYDPVGGEFNTSYVRHFFPGQRMHILTLAHRQQGLLVLPGNPQGIGGLADLVREDVVFINRKTGSGTRLWLDQQLNRNHIESSKIQGYQNEVATHFQVAEAIQSGRVDVGLAVLAAAQQKNLDFVPLFEERFDIIIPDHQYSQPSLTPILESLNSARLRNRIASLWGYRSQDTGCEILVA